MQFKKYFFRIAFVGLIALNIVTFTSQAFYTAVVGSLGIAKTAAPLVYKGTKMATKAVVKRFKGKLSKRLAKRAAIKVGSALCRDLLPAFARSEAAAVIQAEQRLAFARVLFVWLPLPGAPRPTAPDHPGLQTMSTRRPLRRLRGGHQPVRLDFDPCLMSNN